MNLLYKLSKIVLVLGLSFSLLTACSHSHIHSGFHQSLKNKELARKLANVDRPAPVNVWAKNKENAGQIEVFWSQSPGARAYRIYVGGVEKAEVPANLANEVLDGLTPFNGQYTITVKTLYNGYESDPSSAYDLSTTQGSAPPPPATTVPVQNSVQSVQSWNGQGIIPYPSQVFAQAISSTSIRVSWAKVENAKNYLILLDGGERLTVPGSVYEAEVKNLYPRRTYNITVKSMDSTGQKSYPSNPSVNVTTQDGVAGQMQNDSPSLTGTSYGRATSSLVDKKTPVGVGPVLQSPLVGQYKLVFSDEFDGNPDKEEEEEGNVAFINPIRWNTKLMWDGDYNGSWFEYRTINREKQFYVNRLAANSSGSGDTELDLQHKQLVLDRLPASFPASFPFVREQPGILTIEARVNPWYNGHRVGTFSESRAAVLNVMMREQPILSGTLTTYGKFDTKYGYFEAKIKIPRNDGAFPAFWLHHSLRNNDPNRKSEVDVMEAIGRSDGHLSRYIYNSFHYVVNPEVSMVTTHFKPFRTGQFDSKGLPERQGQIYTGEAFSEDFHVYAVKWEPGVLVWYLDGREVSRLSESEWNSYRQKRHELYNSPLSAYPDLDVDFDEMYLMFNLAMGGFWVNSPNSAGGMDRTDGNFFPTWNDLENLKKNPVKMHIDYVRVWKKQ